jgi:hypothetical protein
MTGDLVDLGEERRARLGDPRRAPDAPDRIEVLEDIVQLLMHVQPIRGAGEIRSRVRHRRSLLRIMAKIKAELSGDPTALDKVRRLIAKELRSA